MNLLDSVYADIGTENYPRFSNGNIFAVTAMPYGMAEWCIQTDGGASPWFYNPRHRTFEGIRLTHQPSPWVGDYCAVVFQPTSGKEVPGHSSFRPKESVKKPHIIEAELLRYRLKVSLVPTERGGILRVENKSGRVSGLYISSPDGVALEVKGRTVVGRVDGKYSFGKKDIREYIRVEFDCDITGTENYPNGMRVFLSGENYEARIAHGFISDEITALTSERELSLTFEKAAENAKNTWEKELGRIEVSREDEGLYKLFYSCLYRALLYPIKFYEYDKDGAPVHYNPDAKKAFGGVFYANNGFWDTFRTVYPLLSVISPERNAEMIEGFVNCAEETGSLPRWLAPGDIKIMPGNLLEAVMADAAAKGIIKGELLQRAYKVLLKNADGGRNGTEDYIKYGYYPCEKYKESINETLDSAYGDFCVSVVAALAGDEENAKRLKERSMSYKNLFDKESGFMRGRYANGAFRENFDCYDWGGDCCEGSYWQSSFAVAHDPEGLAELHGGRENLLKKLDELYAAPPVFNVGGYGFEIHEMSEMAAADFGQLAISNQPSFHIPYLYTVLGRRKKTAEIVENLVKNAFYAGDDGFPGDEDNGTMAAWVIFTALGFYPLCPGKAEYVAGKRMFDGIKINGRELPATESDIIKHGDLFGRRG